MIIFKASISRFLTIHISTGMVISIISLMAHGRIGSTVVFMVAVILSGVVAIFIIDYRKKNIVLNESAIEGPSRRRLSDYRITIPYEKIDLSMSARPSIFRNGMIASCDGKKILIYSLYFRPKTADQIFMQLEEKTRNRNRGTAKARHP